MYKEYWEFKKLPFCNDSDQNSFYLSDPHAEGLTRLMDSAQSGQTCALLTGTGGIGKTALGRVISTVLSNSGFQIVFIADPTIKPTKLMEEILNQLEVENPPSTKAEMIQRLHDKLVENREAKLETLLIIDDAHRLTMTALYDLHLLMTLQHADRFLMKILFIGQPDLMQKIRNMPSLHQQVGVSFVIRPFNESETKKYILWRQNKAGGLKNVFEQDAIHAIHESSKGLPQSINNLCDISLMVAAQERQPSISPEVIRRIVMNQADI